MWFGMGEPATHDGDLIELVGFLIVMTSRKYDLKTAVASARTFYPD